ncbi:MAG: hypothetical protein A2758_00335 [Candidatus Zambryskibacteria bacterium RIFCSPHIGHO2_01_FULL_49_18]|uniref:Uncharacterized protein n=2 Tax=Candidatus Zambryskiibacteriota TaxID=1817925 RepID=A0A1G2T2R6_9BACT|nr:MAG: hypothetical protein A2758_00335 [Candidatus Zambryskibacteria bacterium RIFCSPHIGHO2_01_FULL_49_18]OHB05671.1 MAG: hypothetical protein A3A26_02200 [Candidatus Zambryskibacteria bacterium RIFCSPLOWO2_01_FULL_47_14]
MKRINRWFDRFEDKVRGFLSHYPMIYALVGGVGIVSFWRGVWETSDLLGIPSEASLVGGILILMSLGILVTEFLGNRIIISGLRGEKKLEEKTLKEIEDEEMFLSNLKNKVERIEKLLVEMNNKKEI